jgi:hypothetical protein
MLEDATYDDWDLDSIWAKEANSYPDLRWLGTKVMVSSWVPGPTQGRPEPYIIGFDTYDSETNPSIPDDSIDVDIIVNDIQTRLK